MGRKKEFLWGSGEKSEEKKFFEGDRERSEMIQFEILTRRMQFQKNQVSQNQVLHSTTNRDH